MIQLSYNGELYSYDNKTSTTVSSATSISVVLHPYIDIEGAKLYYSQEDTEGIVDITNNEAEIPGAYLVTGDLQIALKLASDEMSNTFTINVTKINSSGDVTDDDIQFTMDNKKRLILVPGSQSILAIQFDNQSEIVTFKFPRYQEEVDLSTKIPYVNYRRPQRRDLGKALCTIEEVTEDTIYFSWLVDEVATQYEGIIQFQVEFTDSFGYRWQSQIGELPILTSLYNTGLEPYSPGILEQYLQQIQDMYEEITQYEPFTNEMKQAILQFAEEAAYSSPLGQAVYTDLYNAFYPPVQVVSITAVFNQGSTVIYDDTAFNDLKQYLTVTARYDDNTTAILPDASYTLSGTLEAGTSTVTVVYNGLTTTFTVNVTARPTLSSITAVYTPGQDTPKTIDSTRISAYIGTEGAWTSYNDSYSVCVPVTVGKQYNLHFSTTDSSLVGTIFRYGFSNTNTPSGQSLSGFARSTPQDLSNVTATATGQYLVIQLSAATAPSTISNGYLTLTELARIIYTTDTLDSLKANLVVTAVYSDSSTTTVAAENYTLIGELTEGTQTITVSYGGKTTTFSVTVVVNGWLYHFNESLLSSGSEDFGFVGDAVFDDGLFGRKAYSRIIPSGTAVEDRQVAIHANNLSKFPNFGGDYTLSFWAKTQDSTYGYPFWATYYNSGSASSSYYSSATAVESGWSVSYNDKNSPANAGYGFQIYQSKINLRISASTVSIGSDLIVTPPSGFSFNAWHHYAVTRKGSTVRLFVDGELVMTATASNSTVYSANQVAIADIFKNSSGAVYTDLANLSNGAYMQDLYVAEFCKWESSFDPQTISY